jgi:hypothetical protein
MRPNRRVALCLLLEEGNRNGTTLADASQLESENTQKNQTNDQLLPVTECIDSINEKELRAKMKSKKGKGGKYSTPQKEGLKDKKKKGQYYK